MALSQAETDARTNAAMANQLAAMERRLQMLEMGASTSQLGFSSIENGSLTVYDANGDPQVVIGKQPDGTYVGGSAPSPQPPPEIPAAPTLVPGFGTIKVQSHGSTDPPWPANFSHLNIYLATGVEGGTEPLTEGKVVGTIIGMNDSAFMIAGLTAGTPYRIWLTSVGNSGTESDYSVAAVATPKLVVGQDILDGAIDELKLADDAVTQAKLAAASVGTIQLGDQVIDVTKLADGSVGGEQIIAAAIAAGHLAAGSVTAVALAARAVQAEAIAAASILAEHLTAGSVTSGAILALAITADKLRANSVTAGAIQAGAITADKIQAGAVLADVSLETGTSGRRIVISGPANEIRFMPSLGESSFGRIFSYISPAYPDDVTVEMRAINSSQTNVMPRFFLSPDRIVLAVSDAADANVNRGGWIDLEEDLALIGMRGVDGKENGLYLWGNGEMKLRGWWSSYWTPNPNDAVWTMNIIYKWVTTGTVGLGIVDFTYGGVTFDSPMAPIITPGAALATDHSVYACRTIQNSQSGTSIQFNTAVPANATIKMYGWFFRTNVIYDATA